MVGLKIPRQGDVSQSIGPLSSLTSSMKEFTSSFPSTSVALIVRYKYSKQHRPEEAKQGVIQIQRFSFPQCSASVQYCIELIDHYNPCAVRSKVGIDV